MATAEVSGQHGPHEGAFHAPLVLTDSELSAVIEAISATYTRDADAGNMLRRIRYPVARAGNFELNPRGAWNVVFADLEAGIIRDPYRGLLAAALHIYPYHTVLRPIAERHGIVAADAVRSTFAPPPEPGRSAVAGNGPEDTSTRSPEPEAPAPEAELELCHVIIRADTEEQRQHAAKVLARLGLAPVEVWSTGTAMSFRVDSTDTGFVRGRLNQDWVDIGWTVVPPGLPDYLLQSLIIEGPDRRRFRVRDVPAQESIRNLASEVISSQYPRPPGDQALPITVDHVRESQPHRVDADNTFDQAGIRDGDTVRVGYQTNAGSVNPDDHEAALYRARNQIAVFEQSHPGFHVRANSSTLPTEYELQFSQRSLGPGPRPGDEPVEIHDHVVLMQLGPEFPREPPALWWESPIFHPNVSPNYGDERSHRSQAAGRVCLGVLAESWQPSWDFGNMCQMLIDMAAYRSYGLFEEIGRRQDGTPIVKADFYDHKAAMWVWRNQESIQEMGGEVKVLRSATRVHYPHVIEAIDVEHGSEEDR